MNFLTYDTETTGLDPHISFIISLGAIVNEDSNKFYSLINWKRINEKFSCEKGSAAVANAFSVHKITDAELQEAPHPIKAFSDFYSFIMRCTNNEPLDCMCGFNITYDQNMMMSNLKFLSNFIEKLDSFNTNDFDENDAENCLKLQIMFEKSYNNVDNKTIFYDCMVYDMIYHYEVNFEKVKHNLNDVGLRYGFPEDENAHNALSDVERTLKIFLKQMEELDAEGITIDQNLEDRFIRVYNRNKEKYNANRTNIKPENNLDYLGMLMEGAKF